MKFLFCFLSVLSMSFSQAALAEKGDGVMLDYNGLTLKMGEKAVVDTNRWDFSDNIYTGKKDDKKRSVLVLTDSKGKVEVVMKNNSFGESEGLSINNLIIKDARGGKFYFTNNQSIFITSYLCEELDKLDALVQVDKCDNLKSSIDNLYSKQFKHIDQAINRLSSVAADGKSQFFNQSKEALQNYNDHITSVKERLDQGKGESFITNTRISDREVLKFIQTQCTDLKRYSKKTADVVVNDKAETTTTAK